jgi:hypothetical protein
MKTYASTDGEYRIIVTSIREGYFKGMEYGVLYNRSGIASDERPVLSILRDMPYTDFVPESDTDIEKCGG